jgi:hypothetical protein
MLDDLIKLYNVLEKSQQTLLENAKRLMGDLPKYECEFGVCSKSPEVDKVKWMEAVHNDHELYTVWAHFMKAEKLLREAQKPYMREKVRIK